MRIFDIWSCLSRGWLHLSKELINTVGFELPFRISLATADNTFILRARFVV